MKSLLLTFFIFQIILGCLGEQRFPKIFKFGAVTAAFAIEGGWDADGKGPQLWDHLADRFPELIAKDPPYNVTQQAQVAADSYHHWQEDVEVVKELGLQFYQFSISWSRILPTGFPNEINQAGINYYNNLINALIAANITPVATLLQNDCPVAGDIFMGGFSSAYSIKAYMGYVEVAFNAFADRIQHWVTFSDPYRYCKVIFGEVIGSDFDFFPRGHYEYHCGHNIILAHAKAYRLFEKKYKTLDHATVAMTFTLDWYEPATQSPEDIEAAKRSMDFSLGWFAHPLVHGNYPKRMIDTIAEVSKKQNFPYSRLPKFTDAEIKEVKGTLDYLSLIPISTYLVSDNKEVEFRPSYSNDVQATRTVKNEWKDPNSLETNTPWGFQKGIIYAWENYKKIPISVTGQGYGAFNDSLNDTYRIKFMKEYLEQVLLLINKKKINIKWYSVWSLIDVFNFQYGYSAKYGLAQVDIDDPGKPRTLKASAKFYKEVIQNWSL